MSDELIDDEVRRSFPGWSDERIREFWDAAQNVEVVYVPRIYESDLSHARIIYMLGWDAFKEYLHETTGTSALDADDYVALTEAVTFLRELENASLYAAIYGAASEGQKKTLNARKKSYEKLTSNVNRYEIDRGM